MPIDPTLEELSSQQNQLARTQMTHEAQQPNPATGFIRNFLDYAQQPTLPQPPAPWEEKINQAMSRQDPRYSPTPPLQQHNWQQWMENALSYIPAFASTLKLTRVPYDGKWMAKDQFDLTHQETGEKRGTVWTTFSPKTKNLKINYFESNPDQKYEYDFSAKKFIDQRKFALGKNPLDALVELKSALPDAFNHYPNIETIEFSGIGGAKREHGLTASLKFKVWKNPDGTVEWEKIKHDTRTR